MAPLNSDLVPHFHKLFITIAELKQEDMPMVWLFK